MKRGRKPKGSRAMTDAERQSLCRDRKNAALAALPGDPLLSDVPCLADYYGNLPTIEDIEAALAHDPRLQAEVRMEYEASLAELGESEE